MIWNFDYKEYTDVNWKVLFIHPRQPFGALIQIYELNAHEWLNNEGNFPKGRRWDLPLIYWTHQKTMTQKSGGGP